jgi:hypothetical protein
VLSRREARERSGSPVLAGVGRGGQGRRGGARCKLTGARVKKSARELRREGEEVRGELGWSLPFIGVGGGPGRWQRVVIAAVNGVNAIDVRAGLRGVLTRGF